MKNLALTVLIGAGLFGCTSEAAEVTPPPAHSHEHTHAAKCGCKLEPKLECAPYVSVDGKFIPLVAGEGVELGAHEFCDKESPDIDVEGEVKDGKFVATKWSYHSH